MNHEIMPVAASDEASARSDPSAASNVLRLLHVEDNPADAMLMQEYIRQSSRQWNLNVPSGLPAPGQVVYTSVEFDLAERLSELTPERALAADCAILDLSLPDASDLQALLSLRDMSDDLPIIVLTGFDDLEVGLSALRHGADDYLVKNQVDGFTLDRAVRYAIARRRLIRDVAAAAATTTLDTATVIMSAAVQAEMYRAKAGTSATVPVGSPSADLARGTHQVSVQIANDGDYSLRCLSCDWVAERGDEDLHTWAERSLDWILLRHLAFGDLPDVAATLPVPSERSIDIGAPAVAAGRHLSAGAAGPR